MGGCKPGFVTRGFFPFFVSLLSAMRCWDRGRAPCKAMHEVSCKLLHGDGCDQWMEARANHCIGIHAGRCTRICANGCAGVCANRCIGHHANHCTRIRAQHRLRTSLGDLVHLRAPRLPTTHPGPSGIAQVEPRLEPAYIRSQSPPFSRSALSGEDSGVSATGRWLSAVSVHVRPPLPRLAPPLRGR